MTLDPSPPSCSVAFVGAGGMVREHARALRDVPGVRLAGVWSRTRDHAQSAAREQGIERVCDSIDELYERTRGQLVVVAVLEPALNAVLRQVLQYPWCVLMEKPPGLDLADARDILERTRREGRRAFVALNRRFYGSTRAALADLAPLEGPRFVHVQDQQDLEAAAQYGHPPELVANWMYANSIHLVDYLRVFGRGDVRSLQILKPWNGSRPGVVAAALEFSSGDSALYTALWNGPGPWAVTVSTPLRRWEMRPLEQAVFQNRGERALNPAPASEWDKAFKPGLRLQAEHAVRAALGETSESIPLADAVQSMELVARIYGHV